MKKFLILTDLDSTFEEFQPGKNEFYYFEKFVQNFEKELEVEVKIHFISGTNKEDLEKRLNFFKTNYPKIYEKIEYAILSHGKKYNKMLEQTGRCETDKASYAKADGVQHIIKDYGKFSLAGVCYMGDDLTDISAFETVRFYSKQFDLGAYALAPRSRRAYDHIKNHIDIYSDKPRILGCVENLEKMKQKIQQTNIQQEVKFEAKDITRIL